MSQDEEGQQAEGEIMGPRNKKRESGGKSTSQSSVERDRGERSWCAQLKKIAKVFKSGRGCATRKNKDQRSDGEEQKDEGEER